MSQTEARTTEAQRSQVPPTLRRWIQDRASGVRSVDRFESENETNRRGWVLTARAVRHLNYLPDGFRLGNVNTTIDGDLRLQVREE